MIHLGFKPQHANDYDINPDLLVPLTARQRRDLQAIRAAPWSDNALVDELTNFGYTLDIFQAFSEHDFGTLTRYVLDQISQYV